MRSIAHCIRNRLLSKHYGDTLISVCLKPYAFSCWLAQPWNLQNMHDMLTILAMPTKEWMQVGWVCQRVLSGEDEDLTAGATLYHASSMDPKPSWVSHPGVSFVGTIGNQMFYKESFA